MIIFHHIKRTGGTFIHRELEQIFNHCTFYHTHHKFDCSINPDTDIQFMSSHDLFKDSQIPESYRDYFYFTIYRYPIDIIHSWIRLRIQLDQKHKHHMDGDAFMRRVINGILDYKHVELPYKNDVAQEVLHPLYWYKYLMIDPDLYDFVGCTELMPTTLSILNQKLGTDIRNKYVNTSHSFECYDQHYRFDEMFDRFSAHIKIWDETRIKLNKGELNGSGSQNKKTE